MKKICYVIAAGDVADIRPEIREGDLVIAADAGYLKLNALGIKADVAAGDFDSLGAAPGNIEVIRHPVRKDDTDMMLAVKIGYARGYREFVLLGGTGGRRADHTIANIQTLIWLAERGASGYMFGDNCAFTAISDSKIVFSPDNEGDVSVFCFGRDAVGVSERGLSYSLDDARLTSSFPLGVSNSFTGSESEIEVDDGTLVIYWQTDFEKFMQTVNKGKEQ